MTRTDSITIGELFPADDILGQWVFSLTCLAEDLRVVSRSLSAAKENDDLGEMLFFYRQLIVRLYEAKRLLHGSGWDEETERFTDKVFGAGKDDLREIYSSREGTASVFAELFANVRHTSVHFSHIGNEELEGMLWRAAGLPAQITCGNDGEDFSFQWVQAVTTLSTLGDPRDHDFKDTFDRRRALAARVVAAWLTLAMLALLGFLHERGIEGERLGSPPGFTPS